LLVEPPEVEGSAALRVTGRRSILADAPVLTPNPSSLVAGMDFSGVRWERAWRMDELPQGFVPLLQAGDAPLLLSGNLERASGGASRAWVLLANLEAGNFTKHPAFPILIANMVQQARQAPLPASFKTGQALPLPAPGNYAGVRIITPAGESSNWQNRWPSAWLETLEAGIYQVELTDGAGRRVVFAAGANAGDENESDLRPRAWTGAVSSNDTPMAGLPGEDDPSFDLWPWLLAATVLVMMAEAWLAWRS
jgi:hypothetical protein